MIFFNFFIASLYSVYVYVCVILAMIATVDLMRKRADLGRNRGGFDGINPLRLSSKKLDKVWCYHCVWIHGRIYSI